MENKNTPKTASVPSSITVSVRPSRGYEAQADVPREIPKGLLAALVAVGSLLVIGVVVVAVLLVTQPDATAAVGTTPAAQTEEPQATPEPTVAPTTTPVPTTPPEDTDDFSAIFDAPENPLLEGLDAD